MKTTIKTWGRTLAIQIPKSLANQLSLTAGTVVQLSKSGKSLIIKPVRIRKRYKLSDLLAQCKDKNPSPELLTGRVGREFF